LLGIVFAATSDVSAGVWYIALARVIDTTSVKLQTLVIALTQLLRIELTAASNLNACVCHIALARIILATTSKLQTLFIALTSLLWIELATASNLSARAGFCWTADEAEWTVNVLHVNQDQWRFSIVCFFELGHLSQDILLACFELKS